MPPVFETVKSFADVPVHADGVDTLAFLEAADGLVDIFDLLGSGVFAFVQTDLRNNIAGVRTRHASRPADAHTLEALVAAEASDRDRTATASLVRLTRGLAFTCHALQNAQADPAAELHTCFRRAYDLVLRHHHTFLVRSVVAIAIRAVPRRPDFYARIAQGADPAALARAMDPWLAALAALVARIAAFLRAGGHGEV
ncbi:hypothetical protein HETIRDRAFT_323721 [Heterobasidion irregulare TC 32-1]|uniref:Glycolipid transfer protein domain-containing protein n=1 Tax=Heterobasidion irregulare (strain TC 32-1) TaxID=747525 RepID=W4JYK8_HETIT|nr:uncharacterized protein HETIRDRAFT_323721 [Heterobasidion irregulare TC 32-1]ETW78534.1 hypothetical protein HETIRDRAFT_323721 [Heterobasidion irregulare TC 32-1]